MSTATTTSGYYESLRKLQNDLNSIREKRASAMAPSFTKEEKKESSCFKGTSNKVSFKVVKGEMFSDVFGFLPRIGGWSKDFHFPYATGENKFTPTPFYPDEELVTRIAMSILFGQKILLVGPAGCGKTTTPQWMAGKMGHDFFRFNFREDMTPDEILGKVEIVSEDGVPVTKGTPGEFVKRFSRPGFLVLDEIFRANPATLMALQSGMEEGGEIRLQHMEGDHVVKRDPNCFIVMCDNSHGTGDNMDKYTTNVHDQSFLNRIDVTAKVTYPPLSVQSKLVQEWTGGHITSILSDKIAKVGELYVKSYEAGDLSIPFSLRTLKTLSEYTSLFEDVNLAIQNVLLSALPDQDERSHLKNLVFTVFGSGV